MSLSQSVAKVPISVVIPVLGDASRAKRCVSHVLQCDPLPSEIIIHCNGLPDGDLAFQEAYFEGGAVPVRVQASAENLGAGGARHELILAAREDLVASFDDDSWPLDKDYFACCLEVMRAQPRAAVLSPAVYLAEKPVMPRFAELSAVRTFEGSASVVRRSSYLQLAGYVPVASAYGVEEADLSMQVHAAGFEVLSCLWMRAWHDRPWSDNRHTVLPWIGNEVLLVFLRFPLWLQPWGWLRALSHIWRHRAHTPLSEMISALLSSPASLVDFRGRVRRISASRIWAYHRFVEKRRLMQWRHGQLEVLEAPASRKALLLQYTNPGGYPPLQHVSLILARAGWRVRLLGLRGWGTAALRLVPMPRVEVSLMAAVGPGLWQKFHYFLFALRSLLQALRWRPHWVYASDPLTAPIALLLCSITKARVLYHEHDSPSESDAELNGWFQSVVMLSRRRLIQRADALVIPSADRRDELAVRHPCFSRAHVVWNMPALHEVLPRLPNGQNSGALRLLYHGSIVPARLGLFILQAMRECGREVHLRVVGYFPSGANAYQEEFFAAARRLDLMSRIEFIGPLPRHELLQQCRSCDLGLCLLQSESTDLNMRHMAGASNKAFDYLSQGLAVLVPDDERWRDLFVEPGYGRACRFGDVHSLSLILRELADDRRSIQKMSQLGYEQIRSQWHYERAFAPVMSQMEQALPER